jgi:hypothetical protein
MAALPVQAGIIHGVGSITTSSGTNNAGPGGTVLINTGTALDGLYGTENLAYLVDDFPGTVGYDGLIIKATAEGNNDGSVNGADNSAILGYGNPVTGHRSDSNFALSLTGPNDGRVFLMAGGNLYTPELGNWHSTFGRGNPFVIDVVASLSGSDLTVTGSMTDADDPGTQILINKTVTVNPATQSTAFGLSSGYENPFTFRNFGIDFTDVSYTSTVNVPEPAALSLVLMGLLSAGLFARRR